MINGCVVGEDTLARLDLTERRAIMRLQDTFSRAFCRPFRHPPDPLRALTDPDPEPVPGRVFLTLLR